MPHSPAAVKLQASSMRLETQKELLRTDLFVRTGLRGCLQNVFLKELFMYRAILAVTFGTALSIKAVKEAAELANAVRAKLLVLHVRSPLDIPHHAEGGALSRVGDETITREIDEEERKFLSGAVEIAASMGVKAETAFISDLLPYEAIIRVCREQGCDLIVMGTRIRHGIPGYLVKSETQKVLEHTETPVLVVR